MSNNPCMEISVFPIPVGDTESVADMPVWHGQTDFSLPEHLERYRQNYKDCCVVVGKTHAAAVALFETFSPSRNKEVSIVCSPLGEVIALCRLLQVARLEVFDEELNVYLSINLE